jgi:Anti-sigma-K factor rskA
MNQYEKLTDLLADRALHGLSDDEQRELEILNAQYPELDEQEFERTAAAIQLTEAMNPEALPSHLRSKVLADAEEFFGQKTSSNVVPFPTPKIKRNQWQLAGWYAAAACLALALIASWQQVKNMFGEKSNAPTIAELRNDLEKKANDKVKASWSATKFPGVENVQGDVVWSNEKQQGYMRFTNLPQNDPQQSVYQLWIFDENQDEKYPVDGGIFDAQNNGEIIVPINAKLKVGKPTFFAITIEKPGGTVVSKRDKLILTAKV